MRIVAPALLVSALAALACLGASAAAAGTTQRLEILDLGDSLSVGTRPSLEARLRRYRIAHLHDVGLHAYDAATIVASLRSSLPSVLVISAGTNDDPRIVSTFWRAVSRVVAVAGPRRCVIWPTIVRPPAVGASYDGLNRALRHVASRHRNLVLVDWAGMVRRHSSWLSGDGVHVSVAGYRARAAAIARAIATRCPA